MSILLTEEQALIGQSAREFAKEYLEPQAVELDHCGRFPVELVKKLAAQDFLGLTVTADYDGAEAGFVSLVEVLENLSRSSAAVASILLHHTLAAHAVQRWASAATKRAWLPSLAKGETLGAFAASTAKAVEAVPLPEGWVLNGSHPYVRNAGVADLYVVQAATETGPALFLVDGTASGLTVGPLAETMGLKGCPVAELAFDNVIVPDSALLAAAQVSELMALQALCQGAQAVGIGQAATEHAAAYAKTRVQFGRPIATLQAIQALLAGAATDCHLGRLAVEYGARLMDEGLPFLVEAAMVQQFLGRMGTRILQDTVQVEGGFGFSEFMPLPRLFRDMAGTTLLDAPGDLPEHTIAAALLA